jgi:hypothetical protein
VIVHEPATLLTDSLLAALAGGLSWRMRTRSAPSNRAQRWWSRMFALTCASAFIGGTFHGFAPEFPIALQHAWWVVTLWIIVALAAALELSLVDEIVPPDRQRFWRAAVAAKFSFFAVLAPVRPVFAVAIAAYGPSLLAWISAAARLRRPWRRWIFGAVALSVIAAVAQQLRWAPAAWFNHNDLYHVIQAVALIAFYRAGRLFHGTANPPPLS